MKKRLAILFLIISLFFLSGVVVSQVSPITGDTNKLEPEPYAYTPASLSAEKLMRIVNDWRVSQGLQPYQDSDFLCDIADTRIEEVKEDWSHNKFAASRFCGASECWLGENLAKNQASEKAVLNDWLNSPSHYDLLTRSYTHACISTDEMYSVLIAGYY